MRQAAGVRPNLVVIDQADFRVRWRRILLVEVAFLTHPQEGARLAQSGYQDNISEGLLRGIRRFVENTRVAENL